MKTFLYFVALVMLSITNAQANDFTIVSTSMAIKHAESMFVGVNDVTVSLLATETSAAHAIRLQYTTGDTAVSQDAIVYASSRDHVGCRSYTARKVLEDGNDLFIVLEDRTTCKMPENVWNVTVRQGGSVCGGVSQGFMNLSGVLQP